MNAAGPGDPGRGRRVAAYSVAAVAPLASLMMLASVGVEAARGQRLDGVQILLKCVYSTLLLTVAFLSVSQLMRRENEQATRGRAVVAGAKAPGWGAGRRDGQHRRLERKPNRVHEDTWSGGNRERPSGTQRSLHCGNAGILRERRSPNVALQHAAADGWIHLDPGATPGRAQMELGVEFVQQSKRAPNKALSAGPGPRLSPRPGL